jgi:hypothetical protein
MIIYSDSQLSLTSEVSVKTGSDTDAAPASQYTYFRFSDFMPEIIFSVFSLIFLVGVALAIRLDIVGAHHAANISGLIGFGAFAIAIAIGCTLAYGP